MTRLLAGLLVALAVPASADTVVRGFLGDLPTFWEFLASADAVVAGSVIDGDSLRVEERIKGASPETVAVVGGKQRLPSGAAAVVVLFEAERTYAAILERNPSATAEVNELRRTRPALSSERTVAIATGERTKVVELFRELLAAQRTQPRRDDRFAARFLELDTLRADGLVWLKSSGVTDEARQVLSQRVLARRGDAFEAAELLTLIGRDDDRALTDAFFDIVKTTLTKPGIARWMQAPFEVLARRVDPALTVPAVTGSPDADKAMREWFAKAEARWKAVRAAR